MVQNLMLKVGKEVTEIEKAKAKGTYKPKPKVVI